MDVVSQRCQEHSSKGGTRWLLLVLGLETDKSWKGSQEVSGPTSTEDRTDFDKGARGLI